MEFRKRRYRRVHTGSFLLGALFVIATVGCTKNQGEEPFGESDPDDIEYDSLCGTLMNGRISNPINGDDGLPVSILSAESSNVVIIQTPEGTQRIKLHAVSDEVGVAARRGGVELLDEMRGPGVFYPPGRGCAVTLRSGDEARLGQLFTLNGENLSEEVVLHGFARSDSGDGCSANQLSSCYDALFGQGDDD